MDKNIISNSYGEIKIIDRKKINLSGVKKLVNFNSKEFLIETTLGVIELKGIDLELIKLDTNDQILSIKGKIDSLIYLDSTKNRDNSILSKLFK